MKKSLLFGAFALLGLPLAQAQFYVQARGGYAFSVAKERVAGLRYLDNPDPNNADGIRFFNLRAMNQNVSEVTFGTGGEGATTSLAFGYFFNKHVGAELGVSFFSSKTSLVQEVEAVNLYYYNSVKFEAQSNQIRLNPTIVIRGGDKGVQPYCRFGLVAPVYGQVDILSVYKLDQGYGLTQYNNDEQVYEQTSKVVFNGAFSLGYNSAFGLHIPLSDHTSVNFEAELLTLGVRGGKSRIKSVRAVVTDSQTKKVLKDTDNFSETLVSTVYDQEAEYVDELTPESNVNSAGYKYDKDKPRNELRRISSYTSLGVYMALRYSF